MLKTKIAVLVSGGGTNLQALLDAEKTGVIKSGEIVVVIASNEKAYALERAKSAGVPAVAVPKKSCASQADYEEKISAVLTQYGVELIVLAGFLSILSADFVARWPKRIINIHPSLIPSFCGEGCYGLRVPIAAHAISMKSSTEKDTETTMAAFTFNRRIGTLTLALSALALSGCAAFAPATPEQQVHQRATERWKALKASQWDKAYAFVTPSFRATMTEERYRERFVGVPKWKNAEVRSVKCEPEKCIAVVRIEALYGARAGLETLSTDVPETWLQEEGQWYKYEAM